MHMCIWAVTSILKIFEYQPGLFIELTGPPPPESDDDSDSEERSSRIDKDKLQSAKADDEDMDMRSADGGEE